MTPVRDIAVQYGLSKNAVQRHKDHLPPALAKDAQRDGGDLVAKLWELYDEAKGFFDGTPPTKEQWRAWLATMDRLVRILESIGKLRGIGVQQGQGGDTHVTNIQVIYGGERGQVTEGEVVGESNGNRSQ